MRAPKKSCLQARHAENLREYNFKGRRISGEVGVRAS